MILEDGTPLRVSFDSHNGYAFSSVERVLIDRHIIARKDISTQAVRDWIAANPDEAAKVRAANRSRLSLLKPNCRSRAASRRRPSAA